MSDETPAAPPVTTPTEPKKPSIADKVKTLDELAAFDKIKAMFTGPSGSGKSRIGALFNRPLIGLTEKQAMRTIRRANKNAKIFMINTIEDMEQFLVLASSSGIARQGFDAVVLDSLTDVQRIYRDELTAKQKTRTDMTDQDTWGVVIDKTARIARVIRDAIVHTVVITGDSEVVMGDIGIVHRPAVNGKKLPNELQQYCNLVGFTRKDMLAAGGKRHSVMFDAGPNYCTKSMEELDAWEPCEPLYWIHKIFGDDLPEDVAARVAIWKEQAASVATAKTSTAATTSAFD